MTTFEFHGCVVACDDTFGYIRLRTTHMGFPEELWGCPIHAKNYNKAKLTVETAMKRGYVPRKWRDDRRGLIDYGPTTHELLNMLKSMVGMTRMR